MKTFQNKATDIPFKDGEITRPASYVDLILVVVRQPKPAYSYDDIKNLGAIEDAIAGSPSDITLEDSYFTYLKNLINNTKWTFRHPSLLIFRDDINGVK